MVEKYSGKDTEFFLEASKVLSSTLDFDELLTRIMELTTAAVGAETGSLLLYDERRGGLVFEVALGEKGEQVQGIVIAPGRGISGKVFAQCTPMIVNDTGVDVDFGSEVDHATGFTTHSILCVPLIYRDRTIGVIDVINKSGGRPFDEADQRLMQSLADLTAMAIENSRLYRRAKQEEREKQSLLEVAKRINSVLELDQILDMIGDSMHDVMHYDALAFYLVDPATQNVRHLISRGFDLDQVSTLPLKISDGIVGWCIRHGESAVVPDVWTDPRYHNTRAETRSEIVAPLFIGGQWRGAINLESNRPAAWNLHELDLLKAFAGQVSVTIEKALLYQESIEKKKLEQELSVAFRIQQSLLPQNQPLLPGYDLAGTNISSEMVGGDYYDFITITDNQLGIVISDVSGKGIPAALIMASFRASLLAEIRNNYAIRTIMAKVGNLLRESFESHLFVTAVYGVLDFENRIFTYSNAGHNWPMLIREDRSIRFLKEGGLPLCVLGDVIYHERRLQLRSGDILVFYTDGVSEAFNGGGEEFGVERLLSILLSNYELPAQSIIDKIVSAVDDFGGSKSHTDDLTLVVLKVG